MIGEETLSRTSIFSLRQSAARFANTISFIFQSSLMGNIGSHVNITSERQRHQARKEAQAISTYFRGAQARPIMCAGSVSTNGELMLDSRCF